MSRNIPDKEMKALIALSGGVCAFPGCNKRRVETGNDDDAAAFLGEMAHIIADSRQGPRGISPMSDEDRAKHTNLVLLCERHHHAQHDGEFAITPMPKRRGRFQFRRADGRLLPDHPDPTTMINTTEPLEND